MSEHTDPTGTEEGAGPSLPKHLSVLVGSLQGPSDLGRNHDKYLAVTDRDTTGEAASA
jgi:hypothetical protein